MPFSTCGRENRDGAGPTSDIGYLHRSNVGQVTSHHDKITRLILSTIPDDISYGYTSTEMGSKTFGAVDILQHFGWTWNKISAAKEYVYIVYIQPREQISRMKYTESKLTRRNTISRGLVHINSLWHSDATYRRRRYWSTLVEVMAFRPFGAKPSREPIQTYRQYYRWEYNNEIAMQIS